MYLSTGVAPAHLWSLQPSENSANVPAKHPSKNSEKYNAIDLAMQNEDTLHPLAVDSIEHEVSRTTSSDDLASTFSLPVFTSCAN